MNKLTWMIFVLLFCATQSFAAEIKIFDDKGLLRAMKFIKTQASVVLRLAETAKSSSCGLESMDGVSSDLMPLKVSGSECRFSPVAAGAWRVKLPPDARLTEVIVDG